MLSKVLLSSMVKTIEQQWAEQNGLSTYVLMQRAGEAVFQLIQQNWPAYSSFCIVAGTGNNGGDGYILAMLLKQAGFTVTLISAGESRQGSDAARAKGEYLRMGGVTEVFFPEASEQYDLMVDALLGTGLHGEVKPRYVPFINFINHSRCPVLSLDLPSGMDADNGYLSAHTVRASITLSFIVYKPGMLSGQARACCGDLQLADLAVESKAFKTTSYYRQGVELRQYARDPASHKGHFGAVLVCGGASGMGGALILAADAAAHMGTGWTMARTDGQHLTALLARNPAIMVQAWDSADELPEKVTALVVGPGIGRSAWAGEYLKRMIAQARERQIPIVIDADALYWLATNPSVYERWVLTPHDGEAARLLGLSTADLLSDRIKHAQAIQQKFGGICVLKGPGTIVTDGHDAVMNGSGCAGMAKAGSGDVLAGMIAGLLARSARFDIQTISEAVWMHGRCGELAAQAQHSETMQAGDLIAALSRVWCGE